MASAFGFEKETAAYCSLIGLPAKYLPPNKPPHDIAFLTDLHTYTISTAPYENLSLHYSKDKKVTLDPQELYRKIVCDGRGRGGYCMELSLLHMHVLRGLGFTTYTAGVRTRNRTDGIPQGDYVGWHHIVNIVTLDDGSQWHVDVGFGGDGATKPLPLISGHAVPNIGTQDIRLVHDFIPEQVDRRPDRKLWIYQFRNGPDKEWNSFYAFPEVEFIPGDFNVVNWYTGSNPLSFQTFTVIIVLFLRREKEDGSGGQEVYGKRMLVNELVKENLDGKTKIVQVCKTEAERIEALRTWFGITLTEEQKEGIKGTSRELRG